MVHSICTSLISSQLKPLGSNHLVLTITEWKAIPLLDHYQIMRFRRTTPDCSKQRVVSPDPKCLSTAFTVSTAPTLISVMLPVPEQNIDTMIVVVTNADGIGLARMPWCVCQFGNLPQILGGNWCRLSKRHEKHPQAISA